MPTGEVEVSGAPSSGLHGSIQATVHEHGGTAPTNIIRTDQAWGVNLAWQIHGPLVPMICGWWCLHIFMESIGPGPEFALPDPGPEILIPVDHINGNYSYHFDVPAGRVTADHCGTPYKVVVAITYKTQYGTPGPLAGFVEGPMLQFYNA